MDTVLSQHSQTRGLHNPTRGHRWKLTIHADGCHFFTSSFRCEVCGALMTMFDERDLKGDMWSAIWMQDDGGAPQCERCEELMDGAEPESSMVYKGGRRGAVH